VRCLTSAGLKDPGSRGPGFWVAFLMPSRNTVFVQGPLTNHSTAVAAAKAESTLHHAVAGGPYVVTAVLGNMLAVQVTKVAHCLSGLPGTGKRSSYSF
jgi:hypothetical protein